MRRIRAGRILLAAAAAVLATLGCAQHYPVTAPAVETQLPARMAADVWPSWSPDGEEILYHRQGPDGSGPAGIYGIAMDGSRRRYLARSGWFFPTRPRLSPSGRYLLLDNLYWILVVDLERGEQRTLIYTDNGVSFPDWSPDERQVVYARAFLAFREPLDSAGVHIIDVDVGRDRYFQLPRDLSGADRPRWCPDGRRIAYVAAAPPRLVVVDTSGANPSVVFGTGSVSRGIESIEWVSPQPGGPWLIVANVSNSGRDQRTLLCNPATSTCETLAVRMGIWDAFRRDMKYLAYVKPTAADSIPVLHVKSVSGDVPFLDLQLTKVDPP